MNKKIALVLEGGGFRGAYTAGCLSWMIDEGITFDYAYGISTGAVHLCSYLIGEKRYLYDLAINYISGKQLVGWRSLLREGRYVGYDYLFNHIFPEVFHYDMERVIANAHEAKVGLYDLDLGHTVYVKVKDLDLNMRLLKGACTLPIIGRIVDYQDKHYLDGGITKMIPIEEAINDNCDAFMVITTKPKDYVRKPSGAIIKALMKLNYPKYPSVYDDYKVRHLNYNEQIGIIQKLQEEKRALYLCPSKTIDVKRLAGDKEDLKRLYALGREDMEMRRGEIETLLKEGHL